MTIVVFGLSQISYNASSGIWNEHNVAPAYLTEFFPGPPLIDPITFIPIPEISSSTYDMSVHVADNTGLFTLFGTIPLLHIDTPKLLLSGHVTGFDTEGGFAFNAFVGLDFVTPELGNNPGTAWAHTLLPPPINWQTFNWQMQSLLHSPDIAIGLDMPAALPVPASLSLVLIGLIAWAFVARKKA
jgi:hypothetical protein